MGERVKLFDPTTDGSMVAKHLKQLFCQIGLPSNTLTPGTVGSFCEVSKKKMQLLKLPSIEAETSIANAKGDKDGDTTGLAGDSAYTQLVKDLDGHQSSPIDASAVIKLMLGSHHTPPTVVATRQLDGDSQTR